LNEARVEPQGLSGDRRFVVVDRDGRFVTGRTQPILTQVHAALQEDALVLRGPEMPELRLAFDTFADDYAAVSVWRDTIEAQRCGSEVDAWFSELLGGAYRLMHFGDRSRRGTKLFPDHPLGFADGFPLLALSDASLAALNDRLVHPVRVSNFRPNLVVSGRFPFDEDGWSRVRVGEVEFDVVKGCDRCVFTTVDPVTGRRSADGEPLRTLAGFRRDEQGDVYFAQNLVPRNRGRIRVGDRVEILEEQPRPVYPDRLPFAGTVAPGVGTAVTVPESWGGREGVLLRCVEIRRETPDVLTFRFVRVDGGRLDFLAGQFLTLTLEIDGEILRRCYTIASSPFRSDSVEVTVKRQPGGRVSNWLHDRLDIGGVVHAAGAAGSFHYPSAPARRVLFLSAGSGITPMLSMVRWLADTGLEVDAVFHHSARRAEDRIAWGDLETLRGRLAGLKLSCNLTGEDAGGADQSCRSGRLDAGMLTEAAPDIAERTVFLCGPAGFMEQARRVLAELGVPEHRVLQERFDVAASAPLDPAVSDGRRVRFRRSGIEGVSGAGQTVLELAESLGIDVPQSCRSGICGSCRSLLQEGEVAAGTDVGLASGDAEQGWFLPCCSLARTDLEVDL
jgi:hypothetical protein